MAQVTNRPSIRTLSVAIGMIAVFLLAAACSQAGYAPSSGSTPVSGSTSSLGAVPSVRITAPAEGATVAAGDLQISIVVSNFEAVNKLGAAKSAGEGHVHFFVDVSAIPTAPGKPAVSAEGTYHAVATTSYTITNVGPGNHTIAAELVNNDHTPLEPPVVAKVSFTVGSGGAAAPQQPQATSGTPVPQSTGETPNYGY